jgi:UDP-N-acetylmuramoyl-tripeptide--D-alanyl-D-alanine ligase
MGLARAINEHLMPGTAVFVAEMGTYGKGEIAELCEFVAPDVAVITSIGPVHLERFGSEESIVEAKREILAKASVAILNVDHPLLAEVADQEEDRLKVIRVSGSEVAADVSVVDGILRIDGVSAGAVGPEVFGSNLAAAAAAAIQCGVSGEEIAARLPSLPVTPHRREQTTSERGFVVIDDTYNSNPAGAGAALDLLFSVPGEGRRVVVTPGMVELGSRQFSENSLFGRAVAAGASDLLVVGKTNRRALVEGARGGAATVTVLSSRQEAVEWVRSQLGPGDAVLYENDLPDHYP